MTDTVSDHPEPELRRIEAGTASPSDFGTVARHLIRGCALCGGCLGEFWDPSTLDGDTLAAAISRAREGLPGKLRDLEREKAEAEVLIARLEGESDARQHLLIRNLEQARRIAVCERLIAESKARRHESVAETLHFAELAVLVAERLDHAPGDLCARAFAERGNAKRIGGDHTGAGPDLIRAQRILDREGLDPLVQAELLSLRATLALDTFRLAEALQLQNRAIKLYSRYGHLSGVAKVLLQLGRIHANRGTPEIGLGLVTKALRILGPESVDLRIAGLSALLLLLIEARHFQVAAEESRKIGLLIGPAIPRLDQLRFDWMGARIDRVLGNYETATSNLTQIRHRLAEESLPLDLALVSVELALTFSRSGQKRKFRTLAAESSRLIAKTKIDREVLLTFLRQSTEFHEDDLRLTLGIS